MRKLARGFRFGRGMPAVIALWLSAGCGGSRAPQDRPISPQSETELAAARAATIPSGIRLVDSRGPSRQGLLVLAQWSFETGDGGQAYSSQAAAALHSAGYLSMTTTDGVLAFAKHVPGDVYRVEIAPRSLGPPLNLSVRFSASPD